MIIREHSSSRIWPKHIAENPLYRHLWYATRWDDRNAVILVDGAPGSCKSGFALRMAQDLDLGWNSKNQKWVSRFKLKHLVFRVKDLIELTKSDFPKGTVVIYDEAGVESDNTTYFDLHSRILRWVLQTWRYKNAILIITTPTSESLTVGIRRVATMRVETFGRKRGCRDKAHCKILFLQPGHKKGKSIIYEKYSRYSQVIDGVKVWRRITSYVFPKASPTLEISYKILKERQTKDWYGLFSSELKYMKNFLQDRGLMSGGEKADVVQTYEKLKPFMSEYITSKGTFSVALVEKKLTGFGVELSHRSKIRLRQLLRADFDTTTVP